MTKTGRWVNEAQCTYCDGPVRFTDIMGAYWCPQCRDTCSKYEADNRWKSFVEQSL